MPRNRIGKFIQNETTLSLFSSSELLYSQYQELADIYTVTDTQTNNSPTSTHLTNPSLHRHLFMNILPLFKVSNSKDKPANFPDSQILLVFQSPALNFVCGSSGDHFICETFCVCKILQLLLQLYHHYIFDSVVCFDQVPSLQLEHFEKRQCSVLGSSFSPKIKHSIHWSCQRRPLPICDIWPFPRDGVHQNHHFALSFTPH